MPWNPELGIYEPDPPRAKVDEQAEIGINTGSSATRPTSQSTLPPPRRQLSTSTVPTPRPNTLNYGAGTPEDMGDVAPQPRGSRATSQQTDSDQDFLEFGDSLDIPRGPSSTEWTLNYDPRRQMDEADQQKLDEVLAKYRAADGQAGWQDHTAVRDDSGNIVAWRDPTIYEAPADRHASALVGALDELVFRPTLHFAPGTVKDTVSEMLTLGHIPTATYNTADLERDYHRMELTGRAGSGSETGPRTEEEYLQQVLGAQPRASTLIAETAAGLVPFHDTLLHWETDSPAKRGIGVGVELIGFTPGVGLVAKVVRRGGTWAEGVKTATGSYAKAPFAAVAHPIEAAKSAGRYVDTAVNPFTLPTAGLESTFGTPRLRVGSFEGIENFTPTYQGVWRPGHTVHSERAAVAAKEAGDIATHMMTHGQDPVFRIGDVAVEMAGTPFQKATGAPALFSTTPNVQHWAVPGGSRGFTSAEGESFLAPGYLGRFGSTSAFGVRTEPGGRAGAVLIRDPNVLSEAHSSLKTYTPRKGVEQAEIESAIGQPFDYPEATSTFRMWGDRSTVKFGAKEADKLEAYAQGLEELGLDSQAAKLRDTREVDLGHLQEIVVIDDPGNPLGLRDLLNVKARAAWENIRRLNPAFENVKVTRVDELRSMADDLESVGQLSDAAAVRRHADDVSPRGATELRQQADDLEFAGQLDEAAELRRRADDLNRELSETALDASRATGVAQLSSVALQRGRSATQPSESRAGRLPSSSDPDHVPDDDLGRVPGDRTEPGSRVPATVEPTQRQTAQPGGTPSGTLALRTGSIPGTDVTPTARDLRLDPLAGWPRITPVVPPGERPPPDIPPGRRPPPGVPPGERPPPDIPPGRRPPPGVPPGERPPPDIPPGRRPPPGVPPGERPPPDIPPGRRPPPGVPPPLGRLPNLLPGVNERIVGSRVGPEQSRRVGEAVTENRQTAGGAVWVPNLPGVGGRTFAVRVGPGQRLGVVEALTETRESGGGRTFGTRIRSERLPRLLDTITQDREIGRSSARQPVLLGAGDRTIGVRAPSETLPTMQRNSSTMRPDTDQLFRTPRGHRTGGGPRTPSRIVRPTTQRDVRREDGPRVRPQGPRRGPHGQFPRVIEWKQGWAHHTLDLQSGAHAIRRARPADPDRSFSVVSYQSLPAPRRKMDMGFVVVDFDREGARFRLDPSFEVTQSGDIVRRRTQRRRERAFAGRRTGLF